MFKFIKKYKWCKRMGINHPIKAALDKNFMRGCFLMDTLLLIGALILDFLLIAFCFWLVTLLLPFLGITFAFTWGKAIVVWIICKIIKLLF